MNTRNYKYTKRLINKQDIWWKRLLNVQAPYRWNLKRLQPGFTLDIGCGIGRNLINLDGEGVGIDHNIQSVQITRNKGLTAFTPDEFRDSSFNKEQTFDSILLSHVAEHMSQKEVIQLIRQHLYLLKAKGKIIIITPQEAGYKSDKTHIEFMDFGKLRNISYSLDLQLLKQYSFPFPRFIGHIFTYNEFISVSSYI